MRTNRDYVDGSIPHYCIPIKQDGLLTDYSQKIGSDSGASRVRLQTSSDAERDLLRKGGATA